MQFFIGTIDDVDYQDHQTFCDIKLKLATNFQSLHYVRVLDVNRREEQQQIEKTIP